MWPNVTAPEVTPDVAECARRRALETPLEALQLAVDVPQDFREAMEDLLRPAGLYPPPGRDEETGMFGLD